MGSTDTNVKQEIYKTLSEFFIVSHNILKRILVQDKKITSPNTFEKYLQELVSEGKVFRIAEEKIRIPVHIEDGKEEEYYGTKGSPRVYYTTQKRLVDLKKEFLKFYKKEYGLLQKKYAEFANMGKNTSKQKRVKTINDFTESFFVLDGIMMSVYSIGSQFSDLSFVINECMSNLNTLRHRFFIVIRDNHKDIYTKFFTRHQLKFLKDNEIHPFNFGKIEYQ